MPFESLPGNTHIQLPNIPWQAAQVGPHDLEPRDPGMGLRTLEKSMESINETIKGLSPLERAKKQMEMQMLRFQQDNIRGYQAHPERYTLTARGPVPIDTYTMAMHAKQLQDSGYTIQKHKLEADTLQRTYDADQNAMDSYSAAKANAKTAPPPLNPPKPPPLPDWEPKIEVPDPMGNSGVSLGSDEPVNLYGN